MKSLFAAFVLLAGSVVAFAQTSSVPGLLSYQGRVTDSAGTAIGAASPVNRTITFKFYSTSSGGTPLYAEAQTVTISGGEFSVLIGNGTGVSGLKGPSAPALTPFGTLSSIFIGNIYLGVTVDDGTAAVDPEIAPRQQIATSAYTFRAKIAETLADGALSTAMLADTAVSTNKIGASQVTTAKIADANIITDKIADANITTAKLADVAVTTAKIADSAITTAKIAANAVTSARIADGTIVGADIADGTILSIDIGDGQVATADLADNGVTTAKIADSAVTTGKINANAVDISKLIAAVQQALCPTGTILAFAGDTAPAGWMMCDGAGLNRNNNPNLFAVIGTRFGFSDTSNFQVPDLRGRFLRGRDGGANRDPDRTSRTTMSAGGATGDAVGSVQGDQFKSHRHAVPTDTRGSGADNQALTGTSGSDENFSYDPGTSFEGGNETRPTNAYVNFIIKL